MYLIIITYFILLNVIYAIIYNIDVIFFKLIRVLSRTLHSDYKHVTYIKYIQCKFTISANLSTAVGVTN